MSNSENSNTKRISIDLPEELITRFDQLRKEWGFRARGPVIEKLLTEILQEDELLPKNQQQTIDYNEKGNISEYSNFDENSALVLIKSDKNENISKESDEKLLLNNNEVIEIPAIVVDKVIDTTGAGDLFASGFLYGLCQNKDLKTCGHMASVAASEIISHYGARPLTKLSTLI